MTDTTDFKDYFLSLWPDTSWPRKAWAVLFDSCEGVDLADWYSAVHGLREKGRFKVQPAELIAAILEAGQHGKTRDKVREAKALPGGQRVTRQEYLEAAGFKNQEEATQAAHRAIVAAGEFVQEGYYLPDKTYVAAKRIDYTCAATGCVCKEG